MTQEAIPAVWMRGGTSKGLFFHDADLPDNPLERQRLLLRLMGSPDPFGKQIDGLGGASSSTSKVVVIKPSDRDDCDVDYWFGHVAIDRPVIDSSGNCGNLSAAVGPFAIDEGLVEATGERSRVRIWQSNLGKRIVAQVPTRNGRAEHRGDFEMDGVPFPGAAITLIFADAGGLDDGSVLPTGNAVDELEHDGGRIEATLVHAGNPALFVRAADLGLSATEQPEAINGRPEILQRMEAIRAAAAVRMGLATTPEAATRTRPATPKIHWLAEPAPQSLASGGTLAAHTHDLAARALSMGRAHHAYPGTSAIATAVAACVPGSIVAECSQNDGPLRIGHASGCMQVDARVSCQQGRWMADSVTLERSARRLMQGEILLP